MVNHNEYYYLSCPTCIILTCLKENFVKVVIRSLQLFKIANKYYFVSKEPTVIRSNILIGGIFHF